MDRSAIASSTHDIIKNGGISKFMVAGLAWLALYIWSHIQAGTISPDNYTIQAPYVFVSTSIIYEPSNNPHQDTINRHMSIMYTNGIMFKKPFATVNALFSLVVKPFYQSFANDIFKQEGGVKKRNQRNHLNKTRKQYAGSIQKDQNSNSNKIPIEIMQGNYANILMTANAMSIHEENLPTGWDDLPEFKVKGHVPMIPDPISNVLKNNTHTAANLAPLRQEVVAYGGKSRKIQKRV